VSSQRACDGARGYHVSVRRELLVLGPSLLLVLFAAARDARGESEFWEEMANPGIRQYRELVAAGRERIDAGDYRLALEGLERARTLMPNEAPAHAWAAYALSRTGDAARAVEAWDRALAVGDAVYLDERLAFECAAGYAQVGRFDDAGEVYGQMLSRGVSHQVRAAVLVNLGDMISAGSCDGLNEAIELYQEAVRDYPDHAGAHWRLAAALMRAGQADEGELELGAALRLDPQWQSLGQGGASIFPTYDLHLYRALGWEHLGHATQARDEWQAYLDGGGSQGCWAETARARIQAAVSTRPAGGRPR
jgi:pentatricopeptide repeat protein